MTGKKLINWEKNWEKLQSTVSDCAKVGSREIKRGLEEVKEKLSKYQLIQKRKDLFAELGRALYEAHVDGLPKEVTKFLKPTELQEIIDEIKKVDESILEAQRTHDDK